MAKIKIEIDTDSDTVSHGGAQILAPKKIGLLSSIDLTQELINAFEDGAGNIPNKRTKSYKGSDLLSALAELTGSPNNCQMIATVGGSIVDDALTSYANDFVSLLGTSPKSSKCVGGIVLASIKSNKERVDHLVNPIGRTRSKVGLYRNPGSAMQAMEGADWTTNVNAGPIRDFSGYNAGSGKGDASHFSADFQNIPAGVDTLVISADPFFQENKQALVDAANSWTRNEPRYVCYPLQDYKSVTRPPESGKSLFYGPSLVDAYRMLGFIAKMAAAGNQVGFYTPLNRVL